MHSNERLKLNNTDIARGALPLRGYLPCIPSWVIGEPEPVSPAELLFLDNLVRLRSVPYVRFRMWLEKSCPWHVASGGYAIDPWDRYKPTEFVIEPSPVKLRKLRVAEAMRMRACSQDGLRLLLFARAEEKMHSMLPRRSALQLSLKVCGLCSKATWFCKAVRAAEDMRQDFGVLELFFGIGFLGSVCPNVLLDAATGQGRDVCTLVPVHTEGFLNVPKKWVLALFQHGPQEMAES